MSKYISPSELASISDRVFRAYARLPEVQAADLLCVDPELLLRSLLGLTVEYRHLSPDGVTLGMTAYEEIGVELYDDKEDLFFFDGKTVLIESDLLSSGKEGRRNFTIMHEGCQHILKMLFPKYYAHGLNARRILEYRNVRGSRTREEWQVDQLSSAILMPRVLIENAMHIVGQEGRIEMLNAVWRKGAYDRFCNMCRLLGVSKQALSIRMKSLGLLGEEHLRYPNEILNVQVEDDDIV